MLAVVAVAMLLFATEVSAPFCTVGSGPNAWSGSPADLALIEAVHQREQAEAAGRAYPGGNAPPSPWSGLVRCAEAPSPS